MTHLKFEINKEDNTYNIINDDGINIGRLEKVRVGQWMSWVLFLNPDCYASASCQDEIREATRMLNGKK